MREMFQYYVEHTYFGPEHERYIAAANTLVPGDSRTSLTGRAYI
jgi:hypothetical protein